MSMAGRWRLCRLHIGQDASTIHGVPRSGLFLKYVPLPTFILSRSIDRCTRLVSRGRRSQRLRLRWDFGWTVCADVAVAESAEAAHGIDVIDGGP